MANAIRVMVMAYTTLPLVTPAKNTLNHFLFFHLPPFSAAKLFEKCFRVHADV